jgi:hypothetical protein
MEIQQKRNTYNDILEEIIVEELVGKLAEQENIANICPVMMQKANEGLLKHGKLSICFLMRKLRCSESMARKIITHVKKGTSDNEDSVALEKC